MRLMALALLAATLLLLGCVAPPAEIRPLPTLNVTPEVPPGYPTSAVTLPALPSSSPTPTIVPTPTGTPMPISTGQCSPSGQCLSPKPLYCADGKTVESCIECGCPSNSRCARSSNIEGFTCLPNEIEGENYSGRAWVNATPEPKCTEDNVSCTPGLAIKCCTTGFGCTWNATKLQYMCLPTPTPSASPAPVPQAYTVDEMLSNLSVAYNATFNSTLSSWGVVQPGVSYAYRGSTGIFDVELYLTKGIYRGFQPSDRLATVEAYSKHWLQTIAFIESEPWNSPYLYVFRMGCFNWTYQVEAKIVEHLAGAPYYVGRNFTVRAADTCPP